MTWLSRESSLSTSHPTLAIKATSPTDVPSRHQHRHIAGPPLFSLQSRPTLGQYRPTATVSLPPPAPSNPPSLPLLLHPLSPQPPPTEGVNFLPTKTNTDLSHPSMILGKNAQRTNRWQSHICWANAFTTLADHLFLIPLYFFLYFVLSFIMNSWERRLDPLGRTYYVDHNNRQTTWTRPR